ncbi:MAG: flagellar hook-associated protein FlgK [Armatimonadetes bacterium]|nr:flagellar hook-associated protein FlgK [Armatimonadota bacterium]
MSIYIGGTFAGLETAVSALRASQAAFETAQHNISNANTVGYLRQSVLQRANYPYTKAGNTHPQLIGQFGTGVTVVEINRNRQGWLDDRARVQASQLGYAEEAKGLLTQAEMLFDDPGSVSDTTAFNPGDFSLRKLMSNYWNSWQEVGNMPESSAYRQALIQRAGEMADKIRGTYGGLEDIRVQADTLVNAKVGEINMLVTQIADLNCQIKRALGVGDAPDDLLDQRDQAVTELSKIINVNQEKFPDGTATIYLEGIVMVQEDRVVNTLQATPDPLNSLHLQVSFSNNPTPVKLRSGELYGVIRTRDVDIPGFQNSLNQLAGEIINQTNALHTTSFRADGTPGGNFFNPAGPNAAQSITVAVTSPDEIAAASSPTAGPGDGRRAFDQAALQYANLGALNNQTPTDFYAALVGNVGNAVQKTERDERRFTAALQHVESQQQELAGVNLDEEFLNITKFQRAYEAASRAVSNYDDLLNQVINRMGRVGL